MSETNMPGEVMLERDAARMCIASLENRVKELESYGRGMAVEYDRFRALAGEPDLVISQTTHGDTTYTVFSNNPQTVVADRNHIAADVRSPSPGPKPIPANAIKPNTADLRRIGG